MLTLQRDAEHRESLSTALRTVRAESLRQANDLQRAVERHAEAQRRADLGEAAETSLRTQLAAADATNRRLREEAARMRQQVAQTRASCANEVRKRDRQIDGLKKAVSDAGRARGERRSPAITTITITGGDSGSSTSATHHQQTPRSALGSLQSTPTAHSSATNAAADMTTTSEYNLRSETNAFLADLARGLSNDNEMLLDLVRHTSRRLQAMSGYVAEEGTMGKGTTASGMVDCGTLAAEMEAVLEHLRTILTNPSFVPIEEVVQRESEIGRLRDGWEKMEGRWKEAVHLLDGWRRRMAVSGRPVNMEEIKMGLRLSPVRVRNVAETSLGLDLRLRPLQEGLNAVAEEEEEDGENDDYEGSDDDDGDADALNWPPLGRTPSPAETLHLVPAPAPGPTNYAHGHDGLSDSESDASSIFADDVDDDEGDFEDDGPNVQIIEQSILVPSLGEASPAPAAFSRSTPSPSPPPPEKLVLSKVTTAAIKEKEKEKEAEKPRAAEAKVNQQGLRPSQTAGNRQGTKTSSSSDIKKELTKTTSSTAPTTTTTTTAVTRGRRRPGEIEETAKDRRQVRIAAATAAAAAAEKPTARPTAPRIAASTTTTTSTTGLSRANSARAAGGRPAPSRQAVKPATTARPVSALAQEKQRPASAASQASDASSAASTAASDDSVALVPSTGASTAPTTSSRPVSSLASRKPATGTSAATAPATSRSRLDRVHNRNASDEKSTTATSATASSSFSEQMPPPPAPATSIAAAANRARSRSPIKIATAGGSGTSAGTAAAAGGSGTAANGVTSRLPLPTSANVPPPASPALNMATIAAKLAASEREADAARVRAKLKAARSGLAGAKAKANAVPTVVEVAPVVVAAETDTCVDPVKKMVAPEVGSNEDVDAHSTSVNSNGEPAQQPLRKKRDPKDKDHRRASKAASRRRSTLNPWELKSLMTASVEGAAPGAETAGLAAVEAS